VCVTDQPADSNGAGPSQPPDPDDGAPRVAARPPARSAQPSADPPARSAASSLRPTLGERLGVLARAWPLFLLLPLALGALTYGWLTGTGRTYTARATLLVYPVESALVGASPDVQASIDLARSYGRLASSPDVLSGAAFALGLPETASTLAPRVTSWAEPDTQLIGIAVEDRDPARAAALANAVGSAFVRWIADRNAMVGADPVRVGLVGPADVPIQANGLPIPRIVALAAVLGLLLAVLGAFALDRLDRRIWNARDVRRAVDRPVVVRLARPWSVWPRSRLVALDAPLSRSADALRSLWIKLGLTSPDDAARAIVVTSAGPARGRSVIAANLALSLAQAGQRVVLVDANLRAPRLDRLFRVKDRAGLSDLLAGAGGWISDHLVDGPVPELKLMLAGSLPRQERERFAVRPLELATAVELLVTALHASGDIVVVDAPPMLEASEALVFASLATRLLVVIQEGQTRPALLAQALDDIQATGKGTVSLVLADAGW
jgi:Mrp family chromosome partitioning ATPase/capsular polysaccharide biosynthesis protein